MRWEGLFADLEAQVEELERQERAAAVETRTRGEIATLTVNDRLRTSIGTSVLVRSAGGTSTRGTVLRVGPDWLLLDDGGGRETVLATRHVLAVRGLGRYSAVPGSESVVESRLGLRHALRGIARDRSPVRIVLAAASGADLAASPEGLIFDATIDRVGADFVEVATHSAGEFRRRDEVREVELIPLAAVVAIKRSV